MIPVARPWMDEREAEAARRAILSGWVTQGPEVAAFEREFAQAVGAPHACAVSSCTTALHLALLALGVGAGDEVVTVSHSFIATANAIRYCGAMPVFVDIEPATFNIDPALVEAAIGPRTKAILAVHQLGMPCDLASLRGDRATPRHSAHRGRGLRHRQRDRLAGRLAADRQAARRHRLLLVPSAQAAVDRRRRHADDVESRARSRVPAAAAARDERARCRAARVGPGHLRGAIRSSATTTG